MHMAEVLLPTDDGTSAVQQQYSSSTSKSPCTVAVVDIICNASAAFAGDHTGDLILDV